MVSVLVLWLPASAVGGVAAAPADATDGSLGSPAPSDQLSALGTSTADERPAAHLSATAAGSDDVIAQSLVLGQVPDDPGEFEAEVTFTVPDAVSELEIGLPADASSVETDGFDAGGGSLEWTGETDEPSATFRLPANQTRTSGAHGATGDASAAGSTGGSDFLETGEWGIVPVPQFDLAWREEEGASVTVERSVAVDGPGAVGSTIAVFGEVDEYESSAAGEDHRLVVPEAAKMTESPTDVLGALGDAAERLEVGAANDELFVVAAPSDGVDWRSAGLQFGDDDAWVRDDAALDEAPNVWIHEYVHTRQPFAGVEDGTTAETAWLVEGQADYYAGLLAYEQGLVDFETFRSFLERGADHPYDQGALADPDSWADSETDYARGPLALGAIDRELRLATDGERTLVDVFRQLNRADEALTHEAFLDTVERYGGSDVRATADRYVATDAIPETWTRSDHHDAFERETSSHEYVFADEPIEVSDEFRETTVDDLEELVAGETAAIPVAVTNVGDQRGPYDAFVQVDGTVVDEVTDELDAGAETTEYLEWSPEEPGSYELRVGDDERSVSIGEPANATVTDLELSSRTADPGESITATVTVSGDEERPAETTVELTTPDGTADERTVRLGPGETERYEATVSFEREGRNEVGAGDERAVVGVGTIPGWLVRGEHALDDVGTTETAAAGGLVVAMVALAVTRRRGLW